MMDPDSPLSAVGHLTQADVTAFVAERFARAGHFGIDTDAQMPRLRALTKKLAREPAFSSTEP